MPTSPAHDPTSPAFVSAVGRALIEFLDGQSELASLTDTLPLLEAARVYAAGGKRLRPAFCYWGYVVAAGRPTDPGPLLRAAASLDLLHASLLVHDDLVDGSDTRRGAPSAHRRFEALLPGPRAARFGEAAAILLGDVLFSWSAEMFESAGLSPEAVRRAAPVLATMRSEVLLGQYLDVAAAFGATDRSTPRAQADTAEKVLEFKSARYSVRRPAELGATLGEAPPDLLAALGTYGSLLGRAFQLRDDLLGVFGDPDITGKPAGDDIREGKRTVLVLTALENGDARQRNTLESLLGSPGLTEEDLTTARDIIEATGARNSCEELIARSTTDALTALEGADMDAEGRSALITLAGLATDRDR
ncbi:polyprenyl synthetase family protein [[Pseudopropionibacterium] massiliense]|uniref:polyprenyl synthetase family protein n=1 Tax=[Pseudopropionibacterium] massiliense TaxID=2220000 RepID=UPI001032359A|nr:polyprenyl synthetase family protein [[Pseudopropionibacterium] massiliense]